MQKRYAFRVWSAVLAPLQGAQVLQRRCFLSNMKPSVTLQDLVFQFHYLEEDRIPKVCECPLCLHPMVDPCSTIGCGHNFCRQCISAAIARKAECPKCKGSVVGLKEADATLNHLLNELTVRCVHSPTCIWTGPRENLSEHLVRFCGQVLVPCTRGCGTQAMKAQMNDHIVQDCLVTKREAANKQVEALRAVFEKINPACADVIKINAGGVRVETTRDTLCRFPESKLAALFAGAWELRKDDAGYVFIDRPGSAFAGLVSWLQCGGGGAGGDYTREVQEEMAFWGIEAPERAEGAREYVAMMWSNGTLHALGVIAQPLPNQGHMQMQMVRGAAVQQPPQHTYSSATVVCNLKGAAEEIQKKVCDGWRIDSWTTQSQVYFWHLSRAL